MTQNDSPTSQNTGVAVVTGAAGGMGQHIAHQLHRDGNRVYLADINLEKAQAVAQELSPDGQTAKAIHLDVSSRTAFVDALAQMRQQWGPRVFWSIMLRSLRLQI